MCVGKLKSCVASLLLLPRALLELLFFSRDLQVLVGYDWTDEMGLRRGKRKASEDAATGLSTGHTKRARLSNCRCWPTGKSSDSPEDGGGGRGKAPFLQGQSRGA
ncbi:hypothetical protein F5Y15DRAFT_383686 [Xylariaceae sp. FL0016]|nr:hypothetical protein F5Y15DRAFT_383686 [Xylariaceae sp. FL0016]